MRFRVNSSEPDLDIIKLRRRAPRNLIIIPRRTAEIALDKYLKKNYNQQLIPLCLKILRGIKIIKAPDKTLLITIPNKELDKFAQLITYGNSEVEGSNILKEALRSKI